jgi:hypothetical protein
MANLSSPVKYNTPAYWAQVTKKVKCCECGTRLGRAGYLQFEEYDEVNTTSIENS